MGEAVLALLPAIIGAGATVGMGIYQSRAQSDMMQQQEQMQQAQQQEQQRMQQQQQQQAQQQAMSARRQAIMAEGPTLQSQVGGSLDAPAFQATAATVTGNPGFQGYMTPGPGNLTPALENLFPSGGVPSLTDPYPMNV